MQQRQAGVQSPQMGGQFGGYMQQMQKQIGGLQNQIQAMSQKQQASTPSAAGNKFLNKTGYKPNNDYVHNKENHLAMLTERLKEAQNKTYGDFKARFNNQWQTISADDYKNYKVNQAEGTLAAMTKYWDLKEKHGDNKAAADKEYEQWRAKHFQKIKLNAQVGAPTEFFTSTYSAEPLSAGTSGSPMAPGNVQHQRQGGFGGPFAGTPFASFSPRRAVQQFGGLPMAKAGGGVGYTMATRQRY